MKAETKRRLLEVIRTYDEVMKVMEHNAAKAVEEDERAYGGSIRAAKGKMQEYTTEQLIRIAWSVELGKDPRHLAINSEKVQIPIRSDYVSSIQDDEIREYIKSKIHDYHYGLSVDKHVFVRDELIMGIECKAYGENAMLKRILVDFRLLMTRHPQMLCYLFQLESQLGGDYSSERKRPNGSRATHTIMSYFPDVLLNIITLLDAERKVNRPINKPEYFKELTLDRIEVGRMAIADGFVRRGVG